MGLHLVVTLLGWAMEVQLGRATQAVEAEDAAEPGDAYTGMVVDASGGDHLMGFTNGLDAGGPYEDWRHRGRQAP